MKRKNRIFTKIQEDFIFEFSKTEFKEIFYLTGGTALSVFYLKHRLSEDLDFFTEEENQVIRTIKLAETIASKIKGKIKLNRSFKSYVEFFIKRGNELLKCDFAQDSPFRLGKKIFNKEYGIFVDNSLDIFCNKISALYDRGEPKDFVDVYFIDKEIMPFERVLKEAKKKHIGIDNYWLAVSMAKIKDVNILPKMIKTVKIEELKIFFEKKAKWLMEYKKS